MAESFDITQPEGRIRQFITLMGAKNWPLAQINDFLDKPRPELSNGIIKTGRELLETDESYISIFIRLAEIEARQGIPEGPGLS